MFKKRSVKSKRRVRRDSVEDNEEDENIEIVKADRTKRHENPNKMSSKKTYAGDERNEDEIREMINLKYKSAMTTESNIDPDRLILGGENPDMGPELDIQTKTRRDDALQKKLQSGELDDNIYRGQAGYRKYHKIRSEAHTKENLAVKGPVRGNSFFRATVRIDHEPCVCKDYKETGFCGFGDSCKFIHDRSDYKMGWQIEREMKEGTYAAVEEENWEVSDEEEDIPFKCIICRDNFKRPIVTKCQHYFCEECAIKHYKTSKRCFACRKQTNGIFNMAKNIVAKLKGIKEREVKNSDWDTRLEAPNSDNSDEDEDAEEMDPEEKAAHVELKELQRQEAEEKKAYLEDVKKGIVVAHNTIQPISDPDSSEDEGNNALLGEYQAEDLTNNWEKQKEKTIKSTVPDHLNMPQFSDSSDSEGGGGDGAIFDPTAYDPRDMIDLGEQQRDERTQNVLELTQNRLEEARIEEERRRLADSQREALEQLDSATADDEVKAEVKTEPMDEDFPPLIPTDVKAEVKTDPDAKMPTPQQAPAINVLNPIAGAQHIPKYKEPQVATNALVANLQSQATSVVPNRPKKDVNQKDVVRSFLPNMKPYDHRDRKSAYKQQQAEFDVSSSQQASTSNHTVQPLAPLPHETKRKNDDASIDAFFAKKKKKTPAKSATWDDLPQDIMNLKSVSNKKVDWKTQK